MQQSEVFTSLVSLCISFVAISQILTIGDFPCHIMAVQTRANVLKSLPDGDKTRKPISCLTFSFIWVKIDLLKLYNDAATTLSVLTTGEDTD